VRAPAKRVRLLLGREKARGDGEEVLAERRERDGPPAPVEQPHPVRFLERSHLRRDGGLAHMAGARRLGEAAGLGDEVEGTKARQGHRAGL
jgi:hypothetical protein